MAMKGIILAGGRGSRLFPLTKGVSKQLLPVYKYPMIYYPIITLKDLGISDILIITTKNQQSIFKETLKDIKSVNLTFKIQEEPRGLAEAFILAEEFLDSDDATLVLGDNVIINNSKFETSPNTIYTFPVQKPEQYGVVVTNEKSEIVELVEKPTQWISNDAVIGLYTLSNAACFLAKTIKPSKRNELEIVDLIKLMNEFDSKVKVKKLDGFWFDCGNFDDLLDCGNLIRTIEHRTTRQFSVD